MSKKTRRYKISSKNDISKMINFWMRKRFEEKDLEWLTEKFDFTIVHANYMLNRGEKLVGIDTEDE